MIHRRSLHTSAFFLMQDHKNCGEMTEIEAKVKYVKLARSLPTYGVSFFLVKVRSLRSESPALGGWRDKQEPRENIQQSYPSTF